MGGANASAVSLTVEYTVVFFLFFFVFVILILKGKFLTVYIEHADRNDKSNRMRYNCSKGNGKKWRLIESHRSQT